MNYERLYEYRFRGIDQEARQAVWNEISPVIYRMMGSPEIVLDPGAGRCEFINTIPARERWVVDEVHYTEVFRAPGVKLIISDVLKADLPQNHFDGVFVSNFLEHLTSQTQVHNFFLKMFASLKTGGHIAVLGPNFRYCAAEYFDCADHTLPLTHLAVAEHLYAAGFRLEKTIARFLPYSFRGPFPSSRMLTRIYLRCPLAWRVFGKQFLLLARKQ
jgi:hypothetical protein